MEFIQDLSTRVQLSEKADLIVFDIHGVLPAHQHSLVSIMDARDRFLGPGGRLIPSRETLWAALVEAPARHQEIVGVWGTDVFGIDMTAIRPTAANTWHKSRIRPAELVTSPACWAVLDYAELRSAHVRGDATWKISDGRVAHGVSVWFDWDDAGGVTFSNSPLSGEQHIFGQAFFPWPEPLALRRGDEVRVRLRADPVAGYYHGTPRPRWDDATRPRFISPTFSTTLVTGAAAKAVERLTPALSGRPNRSGNQRRGLQSARKCPRDIGRLSHRFRMDRRARCVGQVRPGT